MRAKKIFKISFLLFIFLAVFYFIFIIFSLTKISLWQNKIGETLPDTFKIELPVIRNHNNYFCINATVNDIYNADFIIDTKASPLAKAETVNNMSVNYWGNYPVFVSNLYGQKEKYPLYFFDSFKIQFLSFNKPLFKSISKSNAMYDLMSNDVIGKDIIKSLFWKFYLDNDKVILFSNKDSLSLHEETENYVKVTNGLKDNNEMFFPDISTHYNFIFDLGYGGEIMVNKKISDFLSNKFSPRKFLSLYDAPIKNDTTYVFDGINVEWNGIKISNCQIVHSPTANRNLIGAELAGRFNFVLAYNEKKKSGTEDNLYLQPRENFQRFESSPYCSDFGFDIKKTDNGFIVKRIEVGGVADKAGIKVKDKVIDIDSGNFDLNDVNLFDFYLKDKKSVILKIEKDGKIMVKELLKSNGEIQ